MTKKNTETPSKDIKNMPKLSKKAKMLLIFAGFAAAIAYGAWLNHDKIESKLSRYFLSETSEQQNSGISAPALFESKISAKIDEKADRLTVENLQNQVTNLQTILNELMIKNSSADLSGLRQNVDDLRELIVSSVNSKADIQSMLGVINRTDKIEEQIERLARINNEGALLLTAVMLIKESALDGRNFAFEADMLEELAGNNPKVKPAVQTIKNLANKKLYTKTQLKKQFTDIYAELTRPTATEESSQDWRERLNSKLGELVSVKKTTKEENPAPEDAQARFLNALHELAAKQNFAQVVQLIKNSDNSYIKDNKNMQTWIKNVKNKEAFESAVSKIASYSLVLIKLDSLRTREQ